MESFMNRALAYLGLKDIEDDELYAEGYELEDEPGARRAGRSAYQASEPDGATPSRFSPAFRTIGGEDRNGDDRPTGSSSVVRPLVRPIATAKVHVVAPARFSDAQEIGDVVRQGNPAIVNLQTSERDLARRMIDFCSGLTYALNGSMEKVADQVFLLTPTNVEVSPEERQRLQERGLFRP
jgi:cell division inhibitor SepF